MFENYEKPEMEVIRLEESLKVSCFESPGVDTDPDFVDTDF